MYQAKGKYQLRNPSLLGIFQPISLIFFFKKSSAILKNSHLLVGQPGASEILRLHIRDRFVGLLIISTKMDFRVTSTHPKPPLRFTKAHVLLYFHICVHPPSPDWATNPRCYLRPLGGVPSVRPSSRDIIVPAGLIGLTRRYRSVPADDR